MDFSNLGDWVVPALLIVYYLFSAFKNRAQADKRQERTQVDSVPSAQEASRNIREEIARKIAQRQGRLTQEPAAERVRAAQPIAKIASPQAVSAYQHDWDVMMKSPASIAIGPVLIENTNVSVATTAPSLSWLRAPNTLRQAVISAEILGKPRGLNEWSY